MGLRVGAPLGQPHQCSYCGNDVDQFFRQHLSRQFSQEKLSHHNSVNSTQHALTAAKIPSWLEPSGLHQADGKCPDGMTMVPWEQGKYLVWDATCRHFLPVTLSKGSHRARRSCCTCGRRQDHAGSMHTWTTCFNSAQLLWRRVAPYVGPKLRDFLRELGKRLRMVTGEPRLYAFLMQRISVAIQIGNATSVMASLPVNATTSIS